MKKLVDKLFSIQQIRFLFVGGLNTIVGYGFYALGIFLGLNYFIANLLSTILGVIHSYIWNKNFTFKSKAKVTREAPKFVGVYLISFLFSSLVLFILVDKLGINQYISGGLNIIITTLISWFGHKYFSFKDGENEMTKKIKEKWLNLTKPLKIEWIILAIILIISFILFLHPDILATSTHGRLLLEQTLEGKFFNFYDYTQGTAVYLIFIYIIFAIWSIPVLIIYNIFNINFWEMFDYGTMNYYTSMWYKLLPVIFAILTGIILIKIVKEIGLSKSKQKWTLFLFLCSPILIFTQFIFGQYDSICMFFTMLSIYYYIKKDYYKFAGFMSLAIPLKLFPIFIFIPLILLVEKRIFHIIKYFAIGIVGYILCNVLFMGSPAFTEAKTFTSNMFDRFFLAGIPSFSGIISLFILIFMGVCLYCYNKKIDVNNKYECGSYTIYIGLIIYSSFFMFVLWHPQWVILLVPFLILSLMISENKKSSIILLSVLSAGYILVTLNNFPNNVDESLVNLGLLPQIFDHRIFGGELIKKLNEIEYLNLNVYTTLFAGCLLLNLIDKYPSDKKISNNKKIINKDFELDRGYVWLYMFVILMYIVPTLMVYFRSF